MLYCIHPLKIASCLLLVSAVGCSSWRQKTTTNDKSWNPATWFKKEYQEPASMAAIWSPDTLAVANQPTQRGFGARIYFYNARSQAVPVDGDLIVHGYLTTPGREESAEMDADKRFSFPAEKLSEQYSPSDLGASYSIWIPWDEAGGFREEVTLIPTFKSKNGTIVQGAAAKLFLPGENRDKTHTLPSPPMQSVSFQKETVPTNSSFGAQNSFSNNSYGMQPSRPTQQMRTTTIEIPRNSNLNRQNLSFSLNNQSPRGATATDTYNSSGVAVGGQRASDGANRQTRTSAGELPSGNQYELRTLTPPPEPMEQRQLQSPIATGGFQPIHQPVQPAAFHQ